jgi:hypothetical protein
MKSKYLRGKDNSPEAQEKYVERQKKYNERIDNAWTELKEFLQPFIEKSTKKLKEHSAKSDSYYPNKEPYIFKQN